MRVLRAIVECFIRWSVGLAEALTPRYYTYEEIHERLRAAHPGQFRRLRRLGDYRDNPWAADWEALAGDLQKVLEDLARAQKKVLQEVCANDNGIPFSTP